LLDGNKPGNKPSPLGHIPAMIDYTFTVLARLGFGMNLANLFFCHILAGFVITQWLDLNYTMMTIMVGSVFWVSAFTSAFTYLFVEKPVSSLLGRGLGWLK
jgi:hypothetical protein